MPAEVRVGVVPGVLVILEDVQASGLKNEAQMFKTNPGGGIQERELEKGSHQVIILAAELSQNSDLTGL